MYIPHLESLLNGPKPRQVSYLLLQLLFSSYFIYMFFIYFAVFHFRNQISFLKMANPKEPMSYRFIASDREPTKLICRPLLLS